MHTFFPVCVYLINGYKKHTMMYNDVYITWWLCTCPNKELFCNIFRRNAPTFITLFIKRRTIILVVIMSSNIKNVVTWNEKAPQYIILKPSILPSP